jgi:TatA/E family protein of Tat protein translocase
MFGSLGVPELLLIFVVILIVFGPRRIPEIGRTLGKALGEFRKATDDLKSTIEREVRLEELKKIAPPMTTPFEAIATTLESLSKTEPPAAPSPEAGAAPLPDGTAAAADTPHPAPPQPVDAPAEAPKAENA